MKCTKIYNARAQLLFCLQNLLFGYRRRRGLVKIPAYFRKLNNHKFSFVYPDQNIHWRFSCCCSFSAKG